MCVSNTQHFQCTEQHLETTLVVLLTSLPAKRHRLVAVATCYTAPIFLLWWYYLHHEFSE